MVRKKPLLARFQSTLPREERPSLLIFSQSEVNFNPRSHERSDDDSLYTVEYIEISIHAPTRGATEHGSRDGQRDFISIHAPTRGATTNPQNAVHSS